MKFFTNLAAKVKSHGKLTFALYVLAFYILLLLMYYYLIHANLSTAPDFVYNQF